ncbi:pilus assembly protein [Glaciimonas soli]|uniref:Pilus assembly protein PilY n=1 Tax=Glaciimonas soli TaxID=2590999 RepID=A0A843YSZ5_9BURK|nr:PilC/PilY family type IV pilus protein [Glaciimonas soli]MQQ99795.1 pilus assembly protein PilY [Glaciimonas soli]
MKKLNKKYTSAIWALAIAVLSPLPVYAQLVVSDTLNGTSSTYPWVTTGGACLTAGNNTGTIPACNGLAYYSGKTQVGGVSGVLPDPVGQGALRLSNGDTKINGSNGNNNTGAVISSSPFPTSEGVQVTFSTVSYGGNGYSNSNNQASGADGIAFFLMDSSKMVGTAPPPPGAFGGSLGYSCANSKSPSSDGLNGGYVAVGIDEFGNFSNPGDNTATGPGTNPGAITMRGAGSITGAVLKSTYPKYYPSSLSAANLLTAVQKTCATGFLQNWSGSTIVDANKKSIANKQSTTEAVYDYSLIGTPASVAALTATTPATTIYNQEGVAAPLRSKANVFTYALNITQDGYLSLTFSVNGGSPITAIPKQSITATNGPLPANFLFGFTAGTGGGSNVHEILCFKAAQINQAGTSAGTNVQSSQVQVGSQVYFAYYHAVNSWGSLTASNLVANSAGVVSINSTANWDANCVLTGGACSATGGTNTAQAPTARSILSWNDTAATGIPFEYASLSTNQQSLIGGSVDGLQRTSFLRGDRSQEIANGGAFRGRNGVLGDIMNSSPTWVGIPASNYTYTGVDLLTQKSIAEYGASYNTFVSNNNTRQNIVYVGANDGMLHGFRAGAYDSTGTVFNAATNDGQEVLAYVPAAVISSIHPSNTSYDFSSPQYAHNFYVNATPATGDLYYGGAWHTWLVGGLAAGGNATGPINNTTSTAIGDLYALDITNPANFTEANAATVVKGEWNSSAIICTTDTKTSTCNSSLGSVYGTPIIRKMHDGNWAVIFGNGHNSSTGTAGIYIMTVNYSTGATTIRFLDTGYKSTTAKNGIDYVSSADLDGDHVTDYLYAGDFQGNVWRFDVTGSNSANWVAPSKPIFTTAAGQPITTRLTVNAVQSASSNGPARLIIAFGTGQQFPQTLTSATTFVSGTQTLYGIWDWNMTAWNAKSSSQYDAIVSGPTTIGVSSLATQTILQTVNSASGNISGYRTVSQNPVCWSGSTVCGSAASSNTQYGWQLSLPSTTTGSVTNSEQIIYNPVAAYGVFLVNTTIPGVNQVLSCTAQPASGYTMALSPETGGALPTSFFATQSANSGYNPTGTVAGANIVSGLGLSGTGSPSLVTTTTGKVYLVQQVNSSGSSASGSSGPSSGGGSTGGTGSSGSAGGGTDSNVSNNTPIPVDPQPFVAKRITWQKLR